MSAESAGCEALCAGERGRRPMSAESAGCEALCAGDQRCIRSALLPGAKRPATTPQISGRGFLRSAAFALLAYFLLLCA